jgi:hypothetical protein
VGSTVPGAAEVIRIVRSFEELVTTRFADGVNALCWERALAGDFAAVVRALGEGEVVETLDEDRLRGLSLSGAGRIAVEAMIGDMELLRQRDLAPVLNCIRGYPRDEDAGAVPTHVFSFHADSAPIEADTWLCTYHGAPSEGLRNEDAFRRVEIPETRAELLREFGGKDDEEFQTFLSEHCYDLHYAAAPEARPYSFGLGNLWRVAVQYPGCPIPPCLHRAPETIPGAPRLLLIS